MGSELLIRSYNVGCGDCFYIRIPDKDDGFHILVDCGTKDDAAVLGDAVAQDWALRAISDDPRPLLFAIDMAAEGADAEGLLPSVLPGEIPAYAVTDYNFAWVEPVAGRSTNPGVAEPEGRQAPRH